VPVSRILRILSIQSASVSVGLDQCPQIQAHSLLRFATRPMIASRAWRTALEFPRSPAPNRQGGCAHSETSSNRKILRSTPPPTSRFQFHHLDLGLRRWRIENTADQRPNSLARFRCHDSMQVIASQCELAGHRWSRLAVAVSRCVLVQSSFHSHSVLTSWESGEAACVILRSWPCSAPSCSSSFFKFSI